MSERLIIQNDTDLPMAQAVLYAASVVRMGRISKHTVANQRSKRDGYCHAVSFCYGILAVSFANVRSDRIIIMREEKTQNDT